MSKNIRIVESRKGFGTVEEFNFFGPTGGQVPEAFLEETNLQHNETVITEIIEKNGSERAETVADLSPDPFGRAIIGLVSMMIFCTTTIGSASLAIANYQHGSSMTICLIAAACTIGAACCCCLSFIIFIKQIRMLGHTETRPFRAILAIAVIGLVLGGLMSSMISSCLHGMVRNVEQVEFRREFMKKQTAINVYTWNQASVLQQSSVETRPRRDKIVVHTDYDPEIGRAHV